jgi:hypothetical protein
VRRFLKDNSLSIVFLTMVIGSIVFQAIAGNAEFNNEQRDHGENTISLGRYVTSSHFGQAVMENWQSEFLQFALFILGTTWLIQRGSPESKQPGEAGRETEEEQLLGEHAREDSPSWAKASGPRRLLYSNSLLLLMAALFIGTWFADSVCGWSTHNAEEITHGSGGLSYWRYLGTSDFWESTLQNWQSEFLAVGCMAVFSIYLRQRGSPESKPVGTPHETTAATG